MTSSVHQNPSNSKDAALAPYNFVQLPKQVLVASAPPDRDLYYSDRHTGLLRCTLTTETPLYTRAALDHAEYRNLHENKEKVECFYIDPVTKDPVIPGSTLRGMLRTLVEIASFGKLDAVSPTPLVYRAVGDTTVHGDRYRARLMRDDGTSYNAKGKRCKLYTPLMQAGYLEELPGRHWQICPAQKINGVSFARIDLDALERIQANLTQTTGCRNAATIYIQPGPYDYQEVRGGFLQVKFSRVLRATHTPGAGLVAGTLTRSGHIASKRSEAVVFSKDTTAIPIPISDELFDAYRDQLSQEQKKLLGKDGIFNPGQPIFYLIENGKLIFFSHTMMMRLPYGKTPQDFVPFQLRDPAKLDLAEAVFGFVRPSKQANEQSCAGRVYVSDAQLATDQERSKLWWTDTEFITPKILGSPKPTTFQHYLEQAQPDPQVDGSTRDGRPKYKKELADYTEENLQQTILRGHKLYWHKGNVQLNDVEEDTTKLANAKKQDTQHTRIKPVAPGVQFIFTLRFENLTDAELGALLWALLLPGEKSKQYRHKLGMGKPLGLGSVQLQTELCLSNRVERYSQLFNAGGDWCEAVHTESSLASYLEAYERLVLAGIHPQERGQARHLSEVMRIQMLLKLLEWPGPAKAQTRYMEIEREDPNSKRGKSNEYKNRPVLPDPLWIAHPALRQIAAPQNSPASRIRRPEEIATASIKPSVQGKTIPQKSIIHSTASQPKASSGDVAEQIIAKPKGQTTTPDMVRTPEPVVTLDTPQSLAEVKEGMLLEGKVARVEPNNVIIDISVSITAALYKDQVQPPIRDQTDLTERFPVGKIIRIWVKGFNKRGNIQLTMKEPKR